jgi:erythritol transport system ATP-binding protein
MASHPVGGQLAAQGQVSWNMHDAKAMTPLCEGVAADIVLETRNIGRKYSGITALQDVNFRVRRNQVNVLIGENGAGKSTLVRILAGAETPSSGQILIGGRSLTFQSTRDAAKYGIAMVYQELNVHPNLNLSENIFAGREIRGWHGIIDHREQERASRDALTRLRSSLDTRTIAGHLPFGQQQIIELARSLAHQAAVLILDEPTSALTRTESETLFAVIADLKRHGVSVVYISHHLDELLLLGDFFTVLRDGTVVGEAARRDVDRRWIVERMTGRPLQGSPPSTPKLHAEELLSVSGLTLDEPLPEDSVRTLLENVSFSAHCGEIVGIYGLLGSGRTELLEILTGLRGSYRGEIFLRRKRARLNSVFEAAKLGIALVPEDRKRDGIVGSLTIRENISLSGLESLRKGPFISRSAEFARVRQLASQLNLKAEDLDLPITSLSGGNQQKAVLARCLMRSHVLLLLDEPTRGVDVGAKREIYRILRHLAETGTCVIFASSEVEEILTLSDTILVLSRGRLTSCTTVDAASEEQLFDAACSHLGDGEKL